MANDPKSINEVLGEAAKPALSGPPRARAERFNAVGGEALADYELLELLLHMALPRQDTKALAKAHAGTVRQHRRSPGRAPCPLAEIKGLGETSITHLKVLQAVAQRAQRDRIARDQPILSSWSQLIDYCHAQMAFEAVEQFRILFSTRRTG